MLCLVCTEWFDVVAVVHMGIMHTSAISLSLSPHPSVHMYAYLCVYHTIDNACVCVINISHNLTDTQLTRDATLKCVNRISFLLYNSCATLIYLSLETTFTFSSLVRKKSNSGIKKLVLLNIFCHNL